MQNNNKERITETQWHSLVAWNRIADIVEKYIAKGSEVAIEGKLVHRSYEDKQGIKRYNRHSGFRAVAIK